MSIRKTGDPLYPFRFFFRPVTSPVVAPVVRILEESELNPEELSDAIRGMSPRQWAALKQLLLEAKYKSESLLRSEEVASDHGRLAFLTGFGAYADYVIGSFEGLRVLPTHPEVFPEP
jgi:hypothetical protein